MIKKQDKNEARIKRHMRIRRQLTGTSERPRLCVFRSNKHIYCQIVDDIQAKTLVAASTLDSELEKVTKTWDCEAAKAVGALIAKRAKEKGVSAVVFDRAGYIYHGRIAAVADSARENGLVF
jgi:large subunit ribosomal protein L18